MRATGKLIHADAVKIDVDDRDLAHVQTVIGDKLRRGEGFDFSRRDGVGDGHASVCLHPQAGLLFTFYGSRRPALNRAWMEGLAVTANPVTGLHVVPEPADTSKELLSPIGALR